MWSTQTSPADAKNLVPVAAAYGGNGVPGRTRRHCGRGVVNGRFGEPPELEGKSGPAVEHRISMGVQFTVRVLPNYSIPTDLNGLR